MNFLLRTPFFRLLLALIAGIVTSRMCRLYDLTLLALAVPALLVILLSFVVTDVRWSHRLRWGFGAGLIVWVYLLGYLLMQNRESDLRFAFSGDAEVYCIHITAPPEHKERSVLVEAVAERCGRSETDSSGVPVPPQWRKSVRNASPGVILFIRKDSAAQTLRRGDVLIARVKFQPPAPVQNPDGFNYAAYLYNKGFVATAFVDSAEWKKWSSRGQSSVLHRADSVRDRLLAVFRGLGLGAGEFAVLAALTLGYTDELEPDIMAHYSASGAMHVLSVSGLHVGVIYLILNFLVSLVFRKPSMLIPKTILLVIALWFYAVITGLSPSVVRASAMFSMVAVGKAFDRTAQIYNTISSTCFFLLLYNPAYLYDVGFQLSYTAVLGIVYFQPKISPLLSFTNKGLKWLWDLTSVSLAAQLGTLPLSLFYFNQFPNYFLLTNYIAIPLSTFVIYAAVVYLAVFYLPFAGAAAGWIVRELLELLNSSIAWIHQLPGSVLQVYAGPVELAVMGVVLACAIGYTELRNYLFIPVALGAVLLCCLFQIGVELQTLRTERMVYLSDRVESHLLLASGKNEWVHSTDSNRFVKQAGKYRMKNRLKNIRFTIQTHTLITRCMGKRIVVLTDSAFRHIQSRRPLKVDYLIVHRFSRQKAEQLMNCFDAQQVIVGAGVSAYYTQSIREWCARHRKKFYSVAESGAYIELHPVEN